MAKPTPSPAQQAAITQEISSLNNQVTSLQDSANAQTAIIAQKGLIDQAFKDLFVWYNDAVIGKYDAERKAINGSYIASPVVEADILAVAASPPAGRLVPSPPVTAIVRIAEFDAGAYTSTDTNNELQKISDEQPWINYLMSGVPGTTPTVNLTTMTTTALTSSSTTLGITDTASVSFAIGDVLVVPNAGNTDAAVVKVTSVTPGMGVPPPYTFTLGITVEIAPTGSIPSSSQVYGGFTGFTNPERVAKVATNAYEQPIMDALILKIQTALNARLAPLASQITALNGNEDPDGVANITTAKNNAIAAQTFINNYLITTDISNTGLGSLISEYTARNAYLSTRVSQILAAYTGQTENYYDQRYNTANNRGDTARGSLRAQSNAANVQNVLNGMVANIGDQTAALGSILP